VELGADEDAAGVCVRAPPADDTVVSIVMGSFLQKFRFPAHCFDALFFENSKQESA
jgi:hypothetical protein